MRNLKLKQKYIHFKGNKYFTLCTSTPISHEVFLKSTFNLSPIKCEHTETKQIINVYQSKNGNYYHLDKNCDETLVVYMALYSNFKTYAREINMFLSKNEKLGVEGYRNQKYRFEEFEEGVL